MCIAYFERERFQLHYQPIQIQFYNREVLECRLLSHVPERTRMVSSASLILGRGYKMYGLLLN